MIDLMEVSLQESADFFSESLEVLLQKCRNDSRLFVYDGTCLSLIAFYCLLGETIGCCVRLGEAWTLTQNIQRVATY